MIGGGITFALIALFVTLLTSGALSRSKRLKKNPNGVYLPDSLLIIAIIGFVVFTAFAFFMVFYAPELIWFSLVFLLFDLLGLPLLIAWKNCYVLYDDDGFTHSNFWGRKRRYTYDQITSYKGVVGTDITLYVGKKRIFIDKMAMNAGEFYATVMEKHNGNLPREKYKLDPFKGNIANPGGWIFLYVLYFLVAVILIFSYCMMMSEKMDASGCKKQEIVFERWETKNGDLFLYPDRGDYYLISDYAEHVKNIGDIKRLCREEKKFNVSSKHNNLGDTSYYEIFELSYKDEIFFSFEDVNEQHKKDCVLYAMAILAIILFGAFVVVGSLIAGRNPDKYPRLTQMMFKEEHINRDVERSR